jgi:D-inositol-3-phosphate glycosyltransferase
MTRRLQALAMVSMHTSPADQPGRRDSGGMNVVLVNLARALAAQGVEVDLLTRAERTPEVTELYPGVTMRTLAAGALAPLAKGDLAAVTDAFGEAVATLVGRTAPRYNIIHAHYWLSGLATLPVALELGLPFVQSFHTLGVMKNAALAPGDSPEPDRRLFTEAFLASEADAVVAGSSAEVDALIDGLRAPAEQLWVVPPGVDVDHFHPDRAQNAVALRRRLGLEPDRPILVVAGRVQPLKAQDLAVRVLGAIHDQHHMSGWAPLLVVAGEPTEGAEEFRDSLGELAHTLGVGADVRLVGALSRDDLADLFAAASLTLVPSHTETFGLVALESAASGTPVVGFRSTGLLESVAEGESGVLVGTRDAVQWARTISDLLENKPGLQALGTTARAHAEGFTWATAAASLIGVYESLLVPR